MLNKLKYNVQKPSKLTAYMPCKSFKNFSLLTENSAPFSTSTFLKASKQSFFSARSIINSAAIIKNRNNNSRYKQNHKYNPCSTNHIMILANILRNQDAQELVFYSRGLKSCCEVQDETEVH